MKRMTLANGMHEPNIDLSVVVPCYNSEKSIVELVERIYQSLLPLSIRFEIICVNDHSKDSTLMKLKELSVPNLIVVDLMNNVGQFRALICGMDYSSGDFLVTIDDDLQHAPEDIPNLYQKLKQSPQLDVVIGASKSYRKSNFRLIVSRMANVFNARELNKPDHIVMSPFRCMNRLLVNAILSNQTIFPVMGPLLLKCTNRIENVEISHQKRKYGQSNYSLSKLLHVSWNHMINFSSLPIKLIHLISMIFLSTGALAMGFCLFRVIFKGTNFFSMPVLFALVLICTGILLFASAILGEYLYRVLQEVNRTPRYTVRETYRSN